MANPAKRLNSNVEGEFYVDSTCINCDTCRQLAPVIFDERDDYSFVFKQPSLESELISCMQAVIACPTGSIGCNRNKTDYRNQFPMELDIGLYYMGYHSPKSYGGASYVVKFNKQTWLIDSPRYSRYLRDQLADLGGIDYIFLTHQDDVADAHKFASDFDAKRIIHYFDKNAEPDAEIVIKGYAEIELSPGFIIIPTPGHTRGHMCLLVDNRYLFTGDHLSWSRNINGLRASRTMNWYSWAYQIKSLKKLDKYNFEWVLPGHGQRIKLALDKMKYEYSIFLEEIIKPDYW